MARIISVSISDKELLDWVDQMERSGRKLPMSNILRDGLMERKKRWELECEESPFQLRQALKKVKENFVEFHGDFQEFLKKNKLNEAWFDFKTKVDEERKCKPYSQVKQGTEDDEMHTM